MVRIFFCLLVTDWSETGDEKLMSGFWIIKKTLKKFGVRKKFPGRVWIMSGLWLHNQSKAGHLLQWDGDHP
jgi:hypothetical protein